MDTEKAVSKSSEREVDTYLSHLKNQQEQTPAYLKHRILESVRSRAQVHDALTWLSEAWWRMAITTAAPLALGLVLGLSSPDILPEPPADLLFSDDYVSFTDEYNIVDVDPASGRQIDE